LNAYGRSKLGGEIAVGEAGGLHVILRTSWVFSAHGTNFVRTMLRLGATRDQISVVSDQFGGPTAAADVAAAIVIIAETFHRGKGVSGIYHFAGSPFVSWWQFAREIFDCAGMKAKLTEIASSVYPTPAQRPQNSRLDCAKLYKDYGIKSPDWRLGLQSVVEELEMSK
jgi:dTDP-4-dehydrorhamnose reductase